jgi:TRAP-type C4-dicarboxylate transport system permease small subunit
MIMHRFMENLSRLFEILGRIVLCALIVMVCLSILGRSLNSVLHGDAVHAAVPSLANWVLAAGIGPINGDFELVEAGMAFAIFAFMLLCHLGGGHASVDIFTQKLPLRANRFLRMVIEIVFAAILIIIAYQLFQGMLSKYETGQTSFLLQFPVWWGYALSAVASIVAAVIGVYVASIRVLEFTTGTAILPVEMGADH